MAETTTTAPEKNVNWWLSLISDATKFGASMWERYFGVSSDTTVTGVSVSTVNGATTVTLGKMPWLLISGALVLLVVVGGLPEARQPTIRQDIFPCET
jgi:hypothetical protein